MRGQASISPIYRMGEPEAREDAFETFSRIERLRRVAWHKTGVVAVQPGELPEPLRSLLRTWAEDVYGPR